MLYLVIPVHNRKRYTKMCLDALAKQSYQAFKIIVVDDGSTDGTSEMIFAEFPEVLVLFGDGNLWWTASVNMGIEEALKRGATYIMTLNDDTYAPEEFLEKMIYWSKAKPEAILGALELDFDTDKPLFGGEIQNWVFDTKHSLLEQLPPEERVGLHPATHGSGRGLLFPRKVFETIGLFRQQKLPHYAADYDFTASAVNKGFELFYNYDARLYTFPEESGDTQNRKKKTLKNYYKHLFSIKGGGNLKDYTHYALQNCPPHLLPSALLSGYTRRILGYWLKKEA